MIGLPLWLLNWRKANSSTKQDADEDIEVVLMSGEELEAAILNSEPIDAKSITGFYLAKAMIGMKDDQ